MKRPKKPLDSKGEIVLGMIIHFIEQQEKYITYLENKNNKLKKHHK